MADERPSDSPMIPDLESQAVGVGLGLGDRAELLAVSLAVAGPVVQCGWCECASWKARELRL
jgi:hypothetical protein